MLLRLDESIQTEHALPTLYYLAEDARTWQTLLLDRVYGRMFSSGLINSNEARDLCEQMLAAIRGLPASPLREEYEAVYSAIDAMLRGQNATAPVLSVRSPETASSIIRRSHEVAAEVLARAISGLPAGDESWIDNRLYDRRGWLETTFYELRHNGSV